MPENLHSEFSRRFEDFKNIENEMHLVFTPFGCNVNNATYDVYHCDFVT